MSHITSVIDYPVGPHPESPPPILFQSLVVTEPEHHSRRTTTTILGSVVLHSLLIAAVAIIPLLYYNAVPEHQALRAFLVTPLEVQPPPPPPPPRPAGARRVDPQLVTERFVAPIEVPGEIRLDEGLDLGVPGGVPGGVAGGVPGGVVGGIVGGLPLSTAPPPPKLAPIRVGGRISAPKKVKYVAPVYPDLATKARVQGVVILECTISPNGTVTGVTVLRSVPLLDNAAVEAVKQWRYTPTLLNGVPVPVIMTITVTFTLH